MTDGVFSVRGTIAPLADYWRRLRDYPGAGCWSMTRTALESWAIAAAARWNILGCSTGRSRGCINSDRSPGISGAPCFLCATLSKALGGFGGIIPGSGEFVERVRKASHWYDGATSPPAPVTAAAARALELIQADPDLRARLWSNVRLLKDGLRAMGFDVDDTPVPIICLVVGRRRKHAAHPAGVDASRDRGGVHGGLFGPERRGRASHRRLRHAHRGDDSAVFGRISADRVEGIAKPQAILTVAGRSIPLAARGGDCYHNSMFPRRFPAIGNPSYFPRNGSQIMRKAIASILTVLAVLASAGMARADEPDARHGEEVRRRSSPGTAREGTRSGHGEQGLRQGPVGP